MRQLWKAFRLQARLRVGMRAKGRETVLPSSIILRAYSGEQFIRDFNDTGNATSRNILIRSAGSTGKLTRDVIQRSYRGVRRFIALSSAFTVDASIVNNRIDVSRILSRVADPRTAADRHLDRRSGSLNEFRDRREEKGPQATARARAGC